ncbi:hypothetical protein J8J40_26100, partial [Mycobacterium tuberculosis]|nr:hypothetical protein [Mycobacterium tuberculosis]
TEKDFLLHLDPTALAAHDRGLDAVNASLTAIGAMAARLGDAELDEAIATLEPQLAATAARFADLVALRRQMGFGEEKGLAGEMQNAVNDLDTTFAG